MTTNAPEKHSVLPEMTEQEIFDKVATHLLTQMAKSSRLNPLIPPAIQGETCLYRDSFGRKCAVGCLIPDELYDPDMDPRSVAELLDEFPELDSLRKHVALLEDLQGIHDTVEPTRWKTALTIYGRSQEFNTSVLDKFT